MTVKIKVYSDYVCPFCYLAKHTFEEAINGKDVEVEWMPYELRPDPQPQLDPVNDPSKLILWEKYINPMIDKLNIDMKLPNLSPHPYTGLAFEGFHYANENGKAKEYNDRIFKALFEDGENIGEIQVLKKLAKEIGLNVEKFENALLTRKYKEVQDKMLNHAYNEANISAVPTFIIGDTVMSGFNSKEDFETVINGNSNKKFSDEFECTLDGACK